MCCQIPVFATSEANSLKLWLEGIPRSEFFDEYRNGRFGLCKEQPLSHRFIDPHDSWFPVSFDGEGRVLSESITKPFENYAGSQTLKKITAIALAVMARLAQWQGQNCYMALSIMQHYALRHGQMTSALNWHRDASDHTLVVLLDDEKLWLGGDFLYRDADGSITRFQPQLGKGIFFSNANSMHCLEALTASQTGVDRTILTIHQKVIP